MCIIRIDERESVLLYNKYHVYIDGLLQKRCNSIANALELCLSYTEPSI